MIEPVKSEYYDELYPYFKAKGLKLNRFNFKSIFDGKGDANNNFLRFNPLIPIPGISVNQHISYIKGCFNAAFPMHGIMPMVLEECIYNLYKSCVLETDDQFFDPACSPRYLHDKIRTDSKSNLPDWVELLNLDYLRAVIKIYLDDPELFSDSDRTEFGSYLMRRMEKFDHGVLGQALCPGNWCDKKGNLQPIPDNIITALTQPTIIELEDLPDNDDKALIMAFLLTYLFEYRQVMPSIKSIRSKLGKDFHLAEHIHVTIIEEAHRLLSNSNAGGVASEDHGTTQDGKAKAISLFIDMLAEIRAKGEGIFVVEQIPTKLVSDVIKNTNLKIMHRITSNDDRQYLGEAMNMNEQQKKYVNSLKTGEAIIFDEQYNHPIFVKMTEFDNEVEKHE